MIQIPTLDPRALKDLLWPDTYLYNKQWETVYSVKDNYETFVVAGNQLG